MGSALFWIALAVGVVDWFAALRSMKQVRYITKPLTLILLIIWFSLMGRWQGNLVWFGAGLVLSLAGDVLLMLPERFFVAGLGAFLGGHVCYIIGFTANVTPLGWEAGLITLVLIGLAVWIIRPVVRTLQTSEMNRDMVFPVIGYASVITIMLISAVTTLVRPDWKFEPATLVAIGAALFFASDSMLAKNRFVHSIKYGDFLVMMTYHLGQFAIASGVLLHFVK